MPLDGNFPVSRKAEILTKALNLLEKGGWCKHTLRNNSSNLEYYQHCALGAIMDCEGDILQVYQIEKTPVIHVFDQNEILEFLKASEESEIVKLVRFNNNIKTTFEDIKKWFLTRIAEEEEKVLAQVM